MKWLVSVDSALVTMLRTDVCGRGEAVARVRRPVRLLLAAACTVVGAAAMATPAGAAGTVALPDGTVVTQVVASGPARSLGEPAAARDSAVAWRHLRCSLSSADCRDWA